MIKIKIHDIEKHRVETTFRPFLFNHMRRLFRDVGIQFVTQGNDWDQLWMAHPTFIHKNYDYNFCVDAGLKVVDRYAAKGDVFLFDSADSPSLMGSWDVFKNTKAKKLFKNSMYSDTSMYSIPSKMGRLYWGKSEFEPDNYSIDSVEIQSERFEDVMLSGCNWLSTTQPQWFDYGKIEKEYDICALFSFPVKDNWEWLTKHSDFYNDFRRPLVETVRKLGSKYKVRLIEHGQHLPPKEYYEVMQKSKIVFAPFGYGEIAPRDIEAVSFGSILLKNDMSHVNTIPNVYNSATYAPIRWDGSDMENVIETILNDFTALQTHYTDNMRQQFTERFNPMNLVKYTYDWISKLDGYENE
jgi:hypothetical protein